MQRGGRSARIFLLTAAQRDPSRPSHQVDGSDRAVTSVSKLAVSKKSLPLHQIRLLHCPTRLVFCDCQFAAHFCTVRDINCVEGVLNFKTKIIEAEAEVAWVGLEGVKRDEPKNSGGCGSCDCNGCGSCDCNGDTWADNPMDYYAQDGGVWNGSYVKKKAAVIGTKCNSFTGFASVS